MQSPPHDLSEHAGDPHDHDETPEAGDLGCVISSPYQQFPVVGAVAPSIDHSPPLICRKRPVNSPIEPAVDRYPSRVRFRGITRGYSTLPSGTSYACSTSPTQYSSRHLSLSHPLHYRSTALSFSGKTWSFQEKREQGTAVRVTINPLRNQESAVSPSGFFMVKRPI